MSCTALYAVGARLILYSDAMCRPPTHNALRCLWYGEVLLTMLYTCAESQYGTALPFVAEGRNPILTP